MRAASHESSSELLELLSSSSTSATSVAQTVQATLFVKDSFGRTALDWARLVNNETSVIALRKAMLTSINASRNKIVRNSMDFTERLRASNRDASKKLMIALKQRDSLAALEIITQYKELDRDVYDELIEKDLQSGIEEHYIEPFFTDCVDHVGFSSLMIAATWNMIDVCTMLIDLGCQVEQTNKYGHTAFTWACTVGHADIVKMLLFHGANIHHKTLEGRTGLHYACLYCKARVVSVLLDRLFESFMTYRVAHPKATFDSTRWTRYARMLESFLDMKDKSERRAWELLPVLPPGHHVYPNGDSLFNAEIAYEKTLLTDGDGNSRGSSESDNEQGQGHGQGQGQGQEHDHFAHANSSDVDVATSGAVGVAAVGILDFDVGSPMSHTSAPQAGNNNNDKMSETSVYNNLGTEAGKEAGKEAGTEVGTEVDANIDIRPLSRANLQSRDAQLRESASAGAGAGADDLLPHVSTIMTALERRSLLESHVIVNGELRQISRSSVLASQAEKLRTELYSSGSMSRPSNVLQKSPFKSINTQEHVVKESIKTKTIPTEGGGLIAYNKQKIPIQAQTLQQNKRENIKYIENNTANFFDFKTEFGIGMDINPIGVNDADNLDDFSALSLGSENDLNGFDMEWDHDTDNMFVEGLHNIKDAHKVPIGVKHDEEVRNIGMFKLLHLFLPSLFLSCFVFYFYSPTSLILILYNMRDISFHCLLFSLLYIT